MPTCIPSKTTEPPKPSWFGELVVYGASVSSLRQVASILSASLKINEDFDTRPIHWPPHSFLLPGCASAAGATNSFSEGHRAAAPVHAVLVLFHLCVFLFLSFFFISHNSNTRPVRAQSVTRHEARESGTEANMVSARCVDWYHWYRTDPTRLVFLELFRYTVTVARMSARYEHAHTRPREKIIMHLSIYILAGKLYVTDFIKTIKKLLVTFSRF